VSLLLGAVLFGPAVTVSLSPFLLLDINSSSPRSLLLLSFLFGISC